MGLFLPPFLYFKDVFCFLALIISDEKQLFFIFLFFIVVSI